MNSVAEAELLMQLAALLMPENAPIGEMFRNFPAPEGWGGHYLEPDLSLHGVLKDENAALFVEYDGYWRHEEREGMKRDELKNAALLTYAPAGSCVIRISHTTSKPLEDNVLWLKVDTWPRGNSKSLSKVMTDVLVEMNTSGLGGLLHADVTKRLDIKIESGSLKVLSKVKQLAHSASFVGASNTSDQISSFLSSEGFELQKSVLMRSLPCGISIERMLQPKIQWLLCLGLTKSQVAKAVASWPSILALSIEQNLKSTVQWFLELGLTKSQVAKAVATHPQILGLSIEQNLKPSVQWFLELGLTKSQVAKVVATFPQILGYSVGQNLKPTVQWLFDLGLTKSQVAKVVATFPQILGYSIEQNLKLTVQWFLELGLTRSQVAKVVATFPQILGQSIEQNLKLTVQWFLELGLTKRQVAKVVASWPSFLALSIEQNFRPKMLWLQEFGVKSEKIAALTIGWPRLWGYSLEKNLEPKASILAGEIIANNPEILRFSHKRIAARWKILSNQNQISKVYHAMCLTDEVFQRRFCS